MPGPGPGMPPQQPQVPDQVLLQRFQQLSPQEHDALNSVSPEAAAVIMKLVPELKPVIQMMLDDQGGSDDGADEPDEDDNVTTGPAAEQEMAGMEADAQGGTPYPQKPKTALGRI